MVIFYNHINIFIYIKKSRMNGLSTLVDQIYHFFTLYGYKCIKNDTDSHLLVDKDKDEDKDH